MSAARSGGGAYVEGLSDLQAGLRRVSRDAEKVFTKAVKDEVGSKVLPIVNARTPKRSGRLAGRNRVSTGRSSVALENSLPYGNAIHWGRKMWPNAASPRAVPSVVKGSYFMYGPLADHRDEFMDAVATAIDKALVSAGRVI